MPPSAGSPGFPSSWSPATTTARSRRSSRTRARPYRCPSRSPPSARSPRCRRPPWRWSPAGRCATWPRSPGCPARCTSSAATAPSSTSASSSGSPPSWSRCAAGARRAAGDRRRPPGRPAGAQAGQRRGAHPRGRPAGRRRRHRGGPQRPGDLGRRHRHPGQGGHRAVGGGHPQGHRGRPAPDPARRPARCSSSATTSPTRTPSATCTARTSASRSAPATPRPATGSPSRSRPPARSACCWRPDGTGSSASGRCRSSGTRCSPTAVRSRCSPPTPRSPGSATPSRTRRRSSPTWSAAARPGTSASPRSAAASRSGQRYRSGTMTVETRWSGLTVTDWLDKPAGGDHPGRRRRSSPATRPWSGCSPARGRARVEFAPRPEFGQVAIQLQPLERRPAGARLQRAGRALLPRRGVGGQQRRRVRDRQGRRRPLRRRRAGGAGAALRHAEPGAPPAARPRAAGRRRAAVEGLGGLAAAAHHRPRPGRPQRPDPARALPRGDRLDPRRGDHLAARGAGRRPQLGLPLLLAARRGDDRARAGRPRLHRGGRGAAALGRRLHRAHRRAPRAAAPALHGRRLRAGRRGGHRHPARLRRLPAGTGRQPRQPPAPARRLRPDRRPDRRRRRRPRLGPRRRVAGPGEHGRGGRAAAGTSPTTASGRPGFRPGTTSSPR